MNGFASSEDLYRGKSPAVSPGHGDGGTFRSREKMRKISSNQSVCGYYFIDLRKNWTIPSARNSLIDPLHRMLKKNGKVTKRKMGNQDLAFLIVILLFLVPRGQTGESPSNYSRPSAKVCGTVDVRNRISNFDVLKDCEVIEGNLQIVLITNMRCEQCTEQLNSISFPKLREVTGYVVFWRVFGLRSLKNLFPNLSVIRGRLLFQNYALVVFEMDSLEEIGLYSLTHILRGSVLFDKNSQLCFVNTINWDMIAKQGAKRHYIGVSRPEHECPKCPEISSSNEVCPLSNSGKPLCWDKDHCQKDVRQCVKSINGECCHKSCLGGCNGKSSKDCFACKGVVLNNECLEKCPQNTYKYFDRRCVTANECLNTRKPYDWETRELNKTFPFRLVGESCLMECPANFHEEEMVSKTGAKRYKCVPCKGRCKKECEGAKVENIASIQKLYGCTHIMGSLEIQLPYEGNIVEELENSLSSIEEISGYLKVVRSLPLVSLDFLKNLKVIRGEQLESNRSAFVLLDNENLEELWDWSIRDQEIRILKGRLAFHYNPKLCFEKLEKFNEIAKLPPFTNEEVPRGTNGDRVACNITPLEPYIANNTPSMVLIKWKHFQHYDQRKLLGYVIYYTEAPHRNVSFYHNRNVCGGDGWHTDDISIPEGGNNDEMSHPLTLLKPYTQYAYYIKTYAIRSEKSGAQSKIHYFITNPGTPTEPEDLQAYSNSTSEIVISWSPPIKSNGNLTHYEVAGYARKDKILEGIDFCSEPRMVAVDKEPLPMAPTSSPKQDNGHCVCAPQIPEKTGIKDTEDIRTTKIDFEDALQNVYFVRKSNRKKREMTYSDSNHQQQLVHQNPGVYGKASGEKQESSEILAFSQITQLNTTQVVIKNLNYFTNYRVEVRACREVVEGEDGKQSPCSEKRTIEVRTKKNDNADNIPEISLTLDTVNGTLEETRLRWEEPRNPNGLILSYQIEYRRVDNDKYKAVIECITRQKFLEQKKEYVLKNLVPGNYTVHVLASSLAGDGPYSQAMSFFIPTSSRSALADIWPGVIGAFIVSGLFFGFFILWKKKTNGVPKLFANVNPEYVSAATVYVPDEWEVPRKNIELIRELGQGSFGMVYEGIARDIVQGQPEVRCAVKTVNEVATDRDRMEFLNEASVMKAFNTHHVVQLLGVVSEGQPTLVVMELMVNGDLKTYLRSHRPEFCEDKKRQPPTLKRILKMAIEIADGMAYLAAKKFVHRDLAARNCMVAEDLTVKIGDFGMTRDIYETDYYKKGTKGLLPVRWMAPESLKDGVFTSHSDVWSYGVVLWEMVTLASQPYQGLSNDQVLRYVIEGGVMEKPENCPDKLYDLMKMCWHYKPMARPHFMDFVTALLPDASPEFCKNSYYHSSDGQELRAHLESVETEVILPTSETPLRLATDIEDFSVGGSEQELDEDEEEAELDVEPPLMSPQRGILSSASRSENWLKGSTKPAALASVSSSDSSRASKLSNGGASTPVNGYIIGRSSIDTRTTQC